MNQEFDWLSGTAFTLSMLGGQGVRIEELRKQIAIDIAS
jgi:hypothetical protein